ncbi:hypothetical protein EST38_g2529 [Candolleomyces aberdarensis]|uniref:Uncharacterized protein n=1 Tax=Candolleomyces aberdarensis TaxID=2316362 RepID=A0A4V1Q4U7_9AGAR|nr:hypothetical protein EST38_g2529 [Candolleomyces aberdarensis]
MPSNRECSDDEHESDKENSGAPRFGTVQTRGKRSSESYDPLEWGPRKKPRKSDALVHHGRHFGRTIYAFANVGALLNFGIGTTSERPPKTPEERRTLRIFVKLLELVPNLEDRVMSADEDDLSLIAAMIQKGAGNARTDDTRSLKMPILDWIFPRDAVGLYPPLSSSTDNLDWNDPDIQRQLRNKEIVAAADDWPFFLFEGEKFNPANPWEGLLRNRLLVLGYKHIFTSPSSTEDIPRATRSGNAAIHGMTEVTPASLAYVATQIRFALSSVSTFTRSDKATDSERFYQSLLELLEDPREAEEVTELMTWWNRQIFPASSTARPALEQSNSSNHGGAVSSAGGAGTGGRAAAPR